MTATSRLLKDFFLNLLVPSIYLAGLLIIYQTSNIFRPAGGQSFGSSSQLGLFSGLIITLLGLGFWLSGFLSLGQAFFILPQAKELVTKGPYRWLAHPIYLGIFWSLAGLSLSGQSWPGLVYTLIIIGPINYYRAKKEDQALSKKFNRDYQTYQKSRTFDWLKLSWLSLLIVCLGCLAVPLWPETKTKSSSRPTVPASPSLSPQPKIPALSLDSILAADHSWVNQLAKEETATIITTGDVIPARTVNYKMTVYQDFCRPFAKTADFLSGADLTLINLEAPLTKNCPVTNEGMTFCGDQRFVKGLKFAGIDLVNLANNHSLNYGLEGINQTIELLEQHHILTSGFPSNRLTTSQINQTKFGFLGWNLLVDLDQKKILSTIRQADKQVAVLIVSFHWGAEYTRFPADWQIKLAHQAVEAGADLIVGNHPHWIQPIEIYQQRLIVYAHGNFVFDQEWSQETKQGIVGRHTFYQGRWLDSQFLPVLISDYHQPEFIEGSKKAVILEQLARDSRTIAGGAK